MQLADFRPSLWSPAVLMLGIGGYFLLPEEPPEYIGIVAIALAGMLLLALWRTRWRGIATAVCVLALGFGASQIRALYIISTPLLTQEYHNVEVVGTIDEIEPVEGKEKLVLSHLAIEDLPPVQTPHRVRISFRGHHDNLIAGDRIRCTANLYPLPQPIMPGSYEFARHFYFREIGGNGFAMRDAELVESADVSGFHVWMRNLRHRIGEDMRAHMEGKVGTVAAAMTVGETGPIPEETKTALRDSGLAHMLAIAGLHLGIVTGIVFYNVRLLLTLYPPLALRMPVKKIAAACALMAAFIYLLLAGFPIPAQRAFIMVTFFFVGILLDRKGVTLRTLSIAAFVILLLFPESMFGPSFQMSFAATLAIVSLYEMGGRVLHTSGRNWWQRAWGHALGIIATSLIATMSTAPFVLYHFNRFALLGLIANMVVIPLATFIIMPGMVIALLLMPLGLQQVGYVLMQWGTGLMIDMGQWVTSLPQAALRYPSPTDGGLIIASIGLMSVCLIRHRLRYVGLAMIAAGLATIALHEPVDVLIGQEARQVMVRLGDGHYTTLRGTNRSFNVQNWLRSEGQDALTPVKDTTAECDRSACVYKDARFSIAVLKKENDDDALAALCPQSVDVLVAWRYLHPEHCPGPKLLIGREEIEQFGTHALRVRVGTIDVSRTLSPGQGHRIWQPQLTAQSEEEY